MIDHNPEPSANVVLATGPERYLWKIDLAWRESRLNHEHRSSKCRSRIAL